MINVYADLEDCFAKSKTMSGTRSSHYFIPISCNKIAYKLTSEDREFLQFDFNKSLTKEIDIKNIKCFLNVSCIYDTFWWVDKVFKVNVPEGDLKIEFLHTHGPRKTFSWSSVDDKCFVPASDILCVITALQQSLGKCNGSQTLTLKKLWKHMKTIKCSCVYIKLQYIFGHFCL